MNYVNLEIINGVGTIEFFTEQSNALPSDILRKLADTIMIAGEREEIKVVVLKSGGEKAFCAGADFNELMEIKDEKAGEEFFMGFARVILAMKSIPKMIICEVQGKAVGGGVGIAATADFCIATKEASVKLSELSIGIGPFVISLAVERKIGISAFSQLTIDATRFFDAQWCLGKGLFNEVVNQNIVSDRSMELALQLARYHPKAMREMKNIFWVGTENWSELMNKRASICGKLVLSDFTQSFLKKFTSK